MADQASSLQNLPPRTEVPKPNVVHQADPLFLQHDKNNGNINGKWNLIHQNVKFYVSQLNRIYQNTSIHSVRLNWTKLYLPCI